jgi:hypothetical protein
MRESYRMTNNYSMINGFRFSSITYGFLITTQTDGTGTPGHRDTRTFVCFANKKL